MLGRIRHLILTLVRAAKALWEKLVSIIKTMPTYVEPGPPTPPVDPNLFNFCIITGITGSSAGPTGTPFTDDWDVNHATNRVQIGALRKGSGWEVWKAAVVARYPQALTDTYVDGTHGIEETTNTDTGEITFQGTAAIHFLSMFKRVILIHGCPGLVIKRIKDVSLVGTQVGLWTMSNWYPPGPVYSFWIEPGRAAMRDEGLFEWGAPRVAGCGGAPVGTQVVDHYEDSIWPGGLCKYPGNEAARPSETTGGGHVFWQDFLDSATPNIVANIMKDEIFDPFYSGVAGGEADFFFSDNFVTNISVNTNFGAASNLGPFLPISETLRLAYANGLTEAFSGVFAATSPAGLKNLAANVGDHGAGSGISGGALHDPRVRQYWEHSFLAGDGSGYHSQAEIVNGVQVSLEKPAYEVYIGARRSDLENRSPNPLEIGDLLDSGETYVGIPQFETANHVDLQAILDSIGDATNYYICFHVTGGPTEKSNTFLYHGETCEVPV